MAIFSIAYFPPVQYFSELINSEENIIEQNENYTKQSYRNRCEILSSNVKQTLSIPIIKKSGNKQLIKDVKIDYKNDWQNIHLKSLQAAYLSSPFYEFYIDALLPFFEKKYKFLFDLNLEIIMTILEELQIKKKITLTNEYKTTYNYSDFRSSIHPKKSFLTACNKFVVKRYTQVFFEKFDFIPNLSILDLLFNEGPDSINYLLLK
ncbi:MAG: WbqC family protein [Bacteroidales bacterium]|nr:WbqC family protein [Bacteroidales bacterium]